QISIASNVVVVPPEPDSFVTAPTFTPDSAYVDYIAYRGSLIMPSLWRVPFLGGTPQQLVENVWSAVGWSPDGREMAFVRVDVPTAVSSLVIADASGQHERVLATAKEDLASLFTLGSLARPAWSPDGRSIAVDALGPDGARVVAFDAS